METTNKKDRQDLGDMSVQIRKATPADAKAYRELRLEALHNHPTAFSADYAANLAQPPEAWERRLRELDDQTSMLFFAEEADGLAGMTSIVRGTSPKTMHSGTLYGVYVRPAFRGQGLGERIIQACLSWGRERGVRVVKLGVAVTNIPAIRCYARCGFLVYGIEPKAIAYDGIDYDELLMSIDL